MKPANGPPTFKIQLMPPTSELETQPANGIMAKTVSRPIINRVKNGVKIRSKESVIYLWKNFST